MGFTDKISGARIQVIIVAFIAFSCPGMFNALSGTGGAGQLDHSTANDANTALYICFALFGYFGGMWFNLLGKYANKLLMGLGGLTYVFYTIGQYVAVRNPSLRWMAIFSGGLLGVGAGLFWTAQGAMMMAYAPEDRKGTYISIFWIIFNLGGMLGGILVLAVNFNESSGEPANPATYFTFSTVMGIGSISAFFFLVDPETVVREDHVPVVMEKAAGPMEEFKNVALMFMNVKMLLLAPLFVTSNFFYTYQFNAVNGSLFSIRARGLNSALYWGSQMFGAWIFGQIFLDRASISRPRRALFGLVILGSLFTVAWALGAYLQLGWEGGFEKGTANDLIDFGDGGRYIFPLIVFLLYGIADAMLQTFAYWIMGALTNNIVESARFTGFYKGVQSAGAAVAWQADNNLNFTKQLFINWGLLTISIPFTYIVVSKYVTEMHSSGDAEEGKGMDAAKKDQYD